jgi:hypothetical protein
VIVGTAAALLCLLVSACNPVDDPTEHNAVVQLRNDLSGAATVSPCSDAACNHLAGSVRNTIDAGGTFSVNVSAEAPSYYSVRVTGHPPGCLTLNADGSHSMPLSMAKPCSQVR